MFFDEPYTMLLSSLPYLPTPGTSKDLPITRLQLDNRLKWLTPEDRQRLDMLDAALRWAHLPIELGDEQAIGRAQVALEAIDSDFLRPILLERLEMRTFTAALRRRARGESLPRESRWGLGRFVKHIETHFSEPDFGMGHLYPWISQAHKHLQAGEPLELEILLLMECWRQMDRVNNRHAFDFAAVALYVLRWEILHRFMRRQAEAAVTRFDALVAHALEASPVSLEALA
jgi:hypothetical protein